MTQGSRKSHICAISTSKAGSSLELLQGSSSSGDSCPFLTRTSLPVSDPRTVTAGSERTAAGSRVFLRLQHHWATQRVAVQRAALSGAHKPWEGGSQHLHLCRTRGVPTPEYPDKPGSGWACAPLRRAPRDSDHFPVAGASLAPQ